MDEVVIIPIDPKTKEISDQIAAQKKRDNRRKYLKDHILAILALLISFLSLIVSTLGLFLPKSDQPTEQQPSLETCECNQNNLPN